MKTAQPKIITKIEQQSRNKKRYSIYINNEYTIGVSEDVLVKFRLNKGQELDHTFLEEIIRVEEQNKANNYTLKLLSYRGRSEQEIINRMQEKGYDKEIIENTVSFLKQHQYIDDQAFAASLANSKIKTKKIGKARIKQELYSKGIAKDVIQNTVDECLDFNTEYEMAMEIAKKKLETTYKNDEKNSQYRKLGSFLQRRGFDYEIVSKVLGRLIK